jgi:hypothetical protein
MVSLTVDDSLLVALSSIFNPFYCTSTNVAYANRLIAERLSPIEIHNTGRIRPTGFDTKRVDKAMKFISLLWLF